MKLACLLEKNKNPLFKGNVVVGLTTTEESPQVPYFAAVVDEEMSLGEIKSLVAPLLKAGHIGVADVIGNITLSEDGVVSADKLHCGALMSVEAKL
jgi:hypothetical protein